MVTNMTESHLLINLTDIDGLFDKDPRIHKDAHLIKVVDKMNKEVMRYAGSIPGFLGTGGMASKVKAARKTTLQGIPVIIANGRKQDVLGDIFRGKEIGTLFMPQDLILRGRKHWIAFTKSPKGELIIDRGAGDALKNRGKSLLPSGIKAVRGSFSLGDLVVLKDEDNQEIAVGMVNYPSYDIEKVMGFKSAEIESKLGYKYDDEIIHRDNLVVTDGIATD